MKQLMVILVALLMVGCASKTQTPSGAFMPTVAQQIKVIEEQVKASMTTIKCESKCEIQLPDPDFQVAGLTYPTNKWDAKINGQNRRADIWRTVLPVALKAYGIKEITEFGEALANAKGNTINTTTTNNTTTDASSVSNTYNDAYNNDASVVTNTTNTTTSDSYNTDSSSVVTTTTDSNNTDNSDNSVDNSNNSDNSVVDNSVTNP